MSPFTLEGQTLGKYRVLEALGRGGMAQVYRGYHPQLDRQVAIKVLRADLVEQEEFLERFRREAHAVSGLRHANIVQVFDFDIDDDFYYMVMELLEGDTLRARLNSYRVKNERMPLKEVIRTISDMLSGLEYAHSEGVIHRDIKPSNVMLTKKNQAVLTDFGIAQIMGTTQVTASGAMMGTLNYMAPEQGLDGHCDVRSDIYSLGIVLYEMLTGYTPFDADTPLAILMKHLNDPLPLPSQLDPKIPPAFEHIVLKALAKDPEDRYQNATEMLAAIKKISRKASDEVRQMVPPPEGHAPQIVFSGDSRHQISSQRFTSEETDPEIQKFVPEVKKSSSGSDIAKSSLSKRMNHFIENPPSVVMSIMIGLGLFLIFNMFAAMILSITGMNIFNVGWAFEIFLAAAFFTLLAWSVRQPWLLTPAIIIFGNAFVLSYSALTGRWQDWVFLWMLEPIIIAVAILIPLYLRRRKLQGSVYETRAISFTLTILIVLLTISTCWLSFIVTLFR